MLKSERKGYAIKDTDWTTEIVPKLKNRYPKWIFEVNEKEHLIYLYNDASPQKEISFMQADGENVLIMVKSLLKKKELTNGGLRVLNHLNCNLYFLTHQIDIEKRIYKCRCIISKNTLQNEFEDVINYLEGEHQKGRMLLEMECR